MQLSEAIQQSDFLRGLPQHFKASIADLAQKRDYPPGDMIFAEGAFHAEFHLVQSGHVRLEMTVPQRGRIPLLTVGPGELLAWSSLLSDGRMTAAAVALDPVCTLAFDGKQLRQICEKQPEFGYHVMKELAVALSRRLLATRLQLLDLFVGHEPVLESKSIFGKPGDPEC